MTPSERRMEELCAIRRPLTDSEIAEVLLLRKRIRDNAIPRRSYFKEYKRQRYANDPAFRDTVRARSAAYKARQRSGARV
jgi:hypothetical protein